MHNTNFKMILKRKQQMFKIVFYLQIGEAKYSHYVNK